MSQAALLRVALLALLWGSGFLWTKVGLEGLSPAQIVVTRLVLGSLFLLAFLHVIGERLPGSRVTWAHLTVAAMFGNVLPYTLFAVALIEVDSAVGGMLNATTPIWTVLIAVAASRSAKLSTPQLIGVALGLAGTVLIFAPWQLETQFMSLGALACLGGAFCYAVSYVYISRYLTGRGTSPLALSAGQLTAASLVSLVLVLPLGGFQSPEWAVGPLASVAVLGVLSTGLAYVVNYQIITEDGPVLAATVIYLLPVVAMILGVVLLDEELTYLAVAGVAVVLAGVGLSRWPSKRVAPTPTPGGKESR